MPSYEVGYGKPPLSGRFRAGVSGNPKGRPKRKPTPLAERIKSALNAPIEYRERGRTKVATYRELSLKMLVDCAISGDLDAAELALKILRSRRALQRSKPGPDSGRKLDGRLSRSDRQSENRRRRGRARRRACRMVVVVRGLIERVSSRCLFHRQPAGVASRLDSCISVRRQPIGPCSLIALRRFAAEGGSARRSSPRPGLRRGSCKGRNAPGLLPQHMTWSEVYLDLTQMLRPIVDTSSRTPPVIRLSNGGRIDFWSLENPIAGRGRRYRRIVIDEAAFTKDGDNRSDDSMMALWEKGIKPTLFDYGGEALVCSNSAGRNPDNFFYNICTDPQYGFHEFHATTMDNPLLPKRAGNESVDDWRARRARFHEDLRKDNDPLVYAQEYTAEFVDWSGVAFFSREKLLVENRPVPLAGQMRRRLRGHRHRLQDRHRQ